MIDRFLILISLFMWTAILIIITLPVIALGFIWWIISGSDWYFNFIDILIEKMGKCLNKIA